LCNKKRLNFEHFQKGCFKTSTVIQYGAGDRT
jgi:hypothetical protein